MKTKKLLTLSLIAAFLGTLSSCIYFIGSIRGNGHVVERTRDVGSFDEIKVTRGMNVFITQGDTTKVVVVADENLHEIIITEVEGDVLHVYTEKGVLDAEEKKVLVTVKNLREISTSSGSNVFSHGSLKYNDLKISATAGSNIRLDLDSEAVQVDAHAGSNVFLSGKANDATISATSGSNVKAGELQAENCNAKASSGANVFIHVNNQLDAKALSGGNLFYYGEPNRKNISSSSGGNVIGKN